MSKLQNVICCFVYEPAHELCSGCSTAAARVGQFDVKDSMTERLKHDFWLSCTDERNMKPCGTAGAQLKADWLHSAFLLPLVWLDACASGSHCARTLHACCCN